LCALIPWSSVGNINTWDDSLLPWSGVSASAVVLSLRIFQKASCSVSCTQLQCKHAQHIVMQWHFAGTNRAKRSQGKQIDELRYYVVETSSRPYWSKMLSTPSFIRFTSSASTSIESFKGCFGSYGLESNKSLRRSFLDLLSFFHSMFKDIDSLITFGPWAKVDRFATGIITWSISCTL
jgi:hypothetical protein